MDFRDYQTACRATAIYPNHTCLAGVTYTTLGLVGEAGEIANKVKKVLRDHNGILSESTRQEVLKELGDVLWYVAMLTTELEGDLDIVALMNLQKLRARQNKGTLGGAGDNR